MKTLDQRISGLVVRGFDETNSVRAAFKFLNSFDQFFLCRPLIVSKLAEKYSGAYLILEREQKKPYLIQMFLTYYFTQNVLILYFSYLMLLLVHKLISDLTIQNFLSFLPFISLLFSAFNLSILKFC